MLPTNLVLCEVEVLKRIITVKMFYKSHRDSVTAMGKLFPKKPELSVNMKINVATFLNEFMQFRKL